MPIIYEPRGKALEYSELAANLYTGCSHACRYCYCPAILHKKIDDWADDPKPWRDILNFLEKRRRKNAGRQPRNFAQFHVRSVSQRWLRNGNAAGSAYFGTVSSPGTSFDERR